MDEYTPCRLCRHQNPPENRFCGRCGSSLLASSDQLVPRRGEDGPAVAGRTLLPAKLKPAGKALAVGFAALAAEAGLLWLRRRVERTDRTPLPVAGSPKPAVSEYLVSQSLEEVSVWLQEGDSRTWILARRAVRSFGATKASDG